MGVNTYCSNVSSQFSCSDMSRVPQTKRHLELSTTVFADKRAELFLRFLWNRQLLHEWDWAFFLNPCRNTKVLSKSHKRSYPIQAQKRPFHQPMFSIIAIWSQRQQLAEITEHQSLNCSLHHIEVCDRGFL